MFSTLIAKFPGTCKRCGAAFPVGTRIRYGGRGRTYHLKADCPGATYDDDAPEALHVAAPLSDYADRMNERKQMGFSGF